MTRDAYTQYADVAGSEDTRSLEELLEDASNPQLREALEYAYAKLDPIAKEEVRNLLTA